MLEIIILIFLAKEIGNLAKIKGLKVGLWRFYLVVAWIGAELLGIIVGVMLFAKDNIFSIFLVGIAFAVAAYFILKAYLEKLPDDFNQNDIDNIGRQ